MTPEKLLEVLASPNVETTVSELQKTSYPNLPKWSDLKKQYDPTEHSINDPVKYPPKLDDANQDDFKRTSLALQKLAVNRVAQSMFAAPVHRNYSYNVDSDSAQEAVDIIEEVYRTQNSIDSENIERCKKLNATCQIATVWSTYEEENKVGEQSSTLQLAHKTYSEKEGYKLYPINDPNGRLLVMSIGYKDADDIEHLATYINTISGSNAKFILYVKDGDWKVSDLTPPKDLEVFPVVYINLEEPVWGGDSGTNLVEQLEEMESYQGLYIKRNALPTFALDYGEVAKGKTSDTVESSSDSRRIIKLGKGGSMKDVTWAGAEGAISSRYERIRNAFFEQIQVPDTSFSNMIKSNTSAENKELIFADAKARARDLGGEWEKLFYKELKIVLKMVSIMFTSTSAEIEKMSVRSIITPYSIKTKAENAEYVSMAGNSMSLQTKVRVLGEVDDITAEVEAIEEETSRSANNL